MGQDASTERTAVTESSDPGQIREEIDVTRQELGDTVAALSEKADIKTQAKQKLEETKASVSEKTEQLFGRAREASPESATTAATHASRAARENPLPLTAVGAFVVGFIAGRLTKH